MKLALTLPTDISIGLRRAANEMERSLEDTAAEMLRDALISLGHIEIVEADEDSETVGQA